ncbi:MAG: hypothetical protein LBE36_01720 [Flavobacteriaceae bacterium]|jgi:hypothetical protein|nr:hypothetical protein [Flavobacteriaceae bacterium]
MKTIKRIFVIVLFLPIMMFSQDKKLNWTILIDNKIETLSNTYLMVEYGDMKRDTISISVIPGEIVIYSKDYNSITEYDIKELILKFEYAEVCKDITYHSYEIPINKAWINKPYFVLYIYNTDKKENKNIYIPLPNKTYNYDYRFPNSGSRIIQKSLTKEQKRCNIED